MSSDSSSQYDGNVLFDDDELISRSGSQSSVIIEADNTPCFHPEQPNFIPLTTSQTPPFTPEISDSFFSIGLSSQTSQCSRGRRSVGRTHKRVYLKRSTTYKPQARDDSASSLKKAKTQHFYRTFPSYGYTSTLHVPAKAFTRSVEFRHSEGIKRKNAYKPTCIRVVDISILAEVISNLRCSECNGTLILYEEENSLGWQVSLGSNARNVIYNTQTFLLLAIWTLITTNHVSMYN